MIMDNIKILGFNADIASVGETLSQIDDIKKDGESRILEDDYVTV